jgi:hypothetical protein
VDSKKLLTDIFSLVLALASLALIYWSRPLAIRYNRWTTKLRERSDLIPPPPSDRALTMNITIVAILIRIVAITLLLLAWWSLAGHKYNV